MAILKCIGDINDGKEKRDFISGAFLLIEETELRNSARKKDDEKQLDIYFQ